MFLKFPRVYLPLIMKEKILEKAGDMFLTLGFKSVTMDDLAQQMGISKKTIYTHFENKTKLVAKRWAIDAGCSIVDVIIIVSRFRAFSY